MPPPRRQLSADATALTALEVERPLLLSDSGEALQHGLGDAEEATDSRSSPSPPSAHHSGWAVHFVYLILVILAFAGGGHVAELSILWDRGVELLQCITSSTELDHPSQGKGRSGCLLPLAAAPLSVPPTSSLARDSSLSSYGGREEVRLPDPSASLSGAGVPALRVSVVYFAYLNVERDWRALVRLQLLDLVDIGLAEAAVVHVCLSVPAANASDWAAEELSNAGEELVRATLPSALVHRSLGNRFEYPGIRLVWDLAQPWGSSLEPVRVDSEPESDGPTRHLVLYFHAKGMVNNAEPDVVRSGFNLNLTRVVVRPWRQLVQLFLTHPTLNKVGVAASPTGFIWHNFWSHTHTRTATLLGRITGDD